MAEQKTLKDYRAFIAAEELFNKIQSESAHVSNRLQQLEAKLMEIKDRPPSALAAFQAESSPVAVDREALRAEYRDLERRQQFLSKALAEARQQLKDEHENASREICKAARPKFIEVIKRKIAARQAEVAADRELQRLRGELEDQGVRTGSIPVCIGNLTEERAAFFIDELKRSFPELA